MPPTAAIRYIGSAPNSARRCPWQRRHVVMDNELPVTRICVRYSGRQNMSDAKKREKQSDEQEEVEKPAEMNGK